MKNKIISLLFILSAVLSCFSITANAEETDVQASVCDSIVPTNQNTKYFIEMTNFEAKTNNDPYRMAVIKYTY